MVSSSFARILCEFPFIWILQGELFILKPVRISCRRYDIFWFLLVSYPFAYFMIISYKYLFWTYLQYRKNYSDYLFVIELIRIKVELLSYQWNYLTNRLLFIFIEFWVRLWDFAILSEELGIELGIRNLLLWILLQDELFICVGTYYCPARLRKNGATQLDPQHCGCTPS